ncbi:MAG: glycosyltransferase [Gammaproteobacteria bacterium]|nr:MAG: glycosyltransferase [Gammaproteobacteria bacterium]
MLASMDIAFYRYSLLNRGGDRMVLEYANYLAEKGHRVTLYSSVDETVFRVAPAIHCVRVPWPGRAGFLLWTGLHTLQHDITVIDIIHLAPLVRCRGRLVYFAQADDIEYYGRRWQRAMIDLLYRRFFRQNGICIAVYDHLTERFRLRYGATICHTVTNGIDLETFFFEPDPELITAKKGRRALFFMARGDRYRKGYDLALKVFDRLSETLGNDLELWVCGERLEKSYRFPVRHFGVVDDDRLRQILSSADILFYPSRHEGFGLFPLEAMACGCVVVTTDAVPYAREYNAIHTLDIGDAEGMADEIFRLVSSPEQLAAERKAGFGIARKFDLRISRRRFVEILKEISGESDANRN